MIWLYVSKDENERGLTLNSSLPENYHSDMILGSIYVNSDYMRNHNEIVVDVIKSFKSNLAKDITFVKVTFQDSTGVKVSTTRKIDRETN